MKPTVSASSPPRLSINVTRFQPAFIDAVKEFNTRIRVGGWGEFQLSNEPEIGPDSDDTPLRWERWLAVEGHIVRGGYNLRYQTFSIFGQPHRLAFYNLSLSEGVIDRRYSSVALKMIKAALSAQPLLFALGMGGRDRPLPRFLNAAGWLLHEIPFLFLPVRTARVFRNVGALRRSAVLRLASDLAAFTGFASVGFALWRALKVRVDSDLHAEEVPRFEEWADDCWEHCQRSFALIAVRDSRSLNALYLPGQERLTRLKITRGARPIGWAVVRATQMRDHKHFGNLYVGTIVDCLSAVDDAERIIMAATKHLLAMDVDLVVSNQSHRSWVAALRSAGFQRGPSNYVFASSPALAQKLAPFAVNCHEAHINRGDGDGPIHL